MKLIGKNNTLYESITGRVITISPDAIYSDNVNEKPYYEIRIETINNFFKGKEDKFFMYPGTQVLTLINIGERTITVIYWNLYFQILILL